MDQRLVMVVGAAGNLRQLAQDALSADYNMVFTPRFDEAFQSANDRVTYDIILLGADDESIDAFELLDTLKTWAGSRDAAVIFVTGSADTDAEIRALNAGVADYLRQPVCREIFKARVDSRLNFTARIRVTEADANIDIKAKIFLQLKEFVNSYAGGAAVADKASRLHVINLAPFRNKLGDKWTKVGKKVHFVVETMISASITHGEAYRYFGEDVFAVIYPSLTQADGKVRAYALVEKICQRLLGDEFNNGSCGTDFIERVLTFEYVEANEEARRKEEMRRQKIADLKARVLSSISIEYVPIWTPASQFIDGYRASFKRTFEGKLLYGKHVLHGGNVDPLWPDLYAKMIRDVAVKAAAIERQMPYFVLTFHVEAIMSKNFIQQIEPELRKAALRKDLYFEIVGIDDHINPTTLKALLMMLKNFCSKVFIRLSAESNAINVIRFSEVYGIGINLSDISRSGLGLRAAYVVASHFSKKSAQLSLKHYVWDVDIPSDFQVMSAAGFTRMSGKMFGEPTENPGPIRSMSRADIV